MKKVDALEAWKCFGADSAIEVFSGDLKDLPRLINFGRAVRAVVRVQPDNEEIIFLQKAGSDCNRQRAFKIRELPKIKIQDL